MTTKNSERLTDEHRRPAAHRPDAAMGPDASQIQRDAAGKNAEELRERAKEGMKDASGELPKDQV